MGEALKPVDFRPDLRVAMQYAVELVPEDPLNLGDTAEADRDEPDDHVIIHRHEDQLYQVSTTDISQYGHLLTQAVLIGGKEELSPDDVAFIKDAVRHEADHAKAAKMFGNDDTRSYYGVQFTQHEGRTEMLPFHNLSGPLRKIHCAWTAMAPYDRSEPDKALARELGYTQDAETLRAMALEVPPVEADYQLPIGFDIDSSLIDMMQKFFGKG